MHAFSRDITFTARRRNGVIGTPASYGCIRMRSSDIYTVQPRRIRARYIVGRAARCCVQVWCRLIRWLPLIGAICDAIVVDAELRARRCGYKQIRARFAERNVKNPLANSEAVTAACRMLSGVSRDTNACQRPHDRLTRENAFGYKPESRASTRHQPIYHFCWTLIRGLCLTYWLPVQVRGQKLFDNCARVDSPVATQKSCLQTAKFARCLQVPGATPNLASRPNAGTIPLKPCLIRRTAA